MFLDGIKFNFYVVGKSVYYIVEFVGFEVFLNINILLVECKSVGKEELFIREKFLLVLVIFKLNDEVYGVVFVKSMVEFDGLGYFVVIYI